MLKANNTEIVTTLIQMVYDVYNDCLYQTSSAYSWPARSLTNMLNMHFSSVVSDDGADVQIEPFKPSSMQVHYRDPVHYREVMECIKIVEVQRIKEILEECLVLSVQIEAA